MEGERDEEIDSEIISVAMETSGVLVISEAVVGLVVESGTTALITAGVISRSTLWMLATFGLSEASGRAGETISSLLTETECSARESEAKVGEEDSDDSEESGASDDSGTAEEASVADEL